MAARRLEFTVSAQHQPATKCCVFSRKAWLINFSKTVNPFNQTHGGPDDHVRHLGDLGNIEAGANGTAIVSINDSKIKLDGPNSIIGVSLNPQAIFLWIHNKPLLQSNV